MPRAPLLALASLVLALSPACTKKNPLYCNTTADCVNGASCEMRAHECVLTDGGAGETRDGDAGEAKFSCNQCLDGGVDAGTVCDVDASMCVECLQSTDCSGKMYTPICEARMCRACKVDSECSPDPGICLSDGHCATSSEVIFVEFRSSGCGSADGSSANPYCTLTDGAAQLMGVRNVMVIRGAVDGPLTLNTSLVQPVIVGKPTTGGEPGQVVTGVSSGIIVSTGNVLIRDLQVVGGGGAMSKGLVATGSSTTVSLSAVRVALMSGGLGIQADSGAQLTMDRCTVTNNSVGGLLINGAGYDIQNSIFATNGFSQLQFSATLNPGTPTFRFNTVVATTGNAATCDPLNKRTLSDSIIVGGQNCTLQESVMTMPAFSSTRPYHLMAKLPCPDADASTFPDHDIDNEPRTRPLDCGADQFVQ